MKYYLSSLLTVVPRTLIFTQLREQSVRDVSLRYKSSRLTDLYTYMYEYLQSKRQPFYKKKKTVLTLTATLYAVNFTLEAVFAKMLFQAPKLYVRHEFLIIKIHQRTFCLGENIILIIYIHTYNYTYNDKALCTHTIYQIINLTVIGSGSSIRLFDLDFKLPI